MLRKVEVSKPDVKEKKLIVVLGDIFGQRCVIVFVSRKSCLQRNQKDVILKTASPTDCQIILVLCKARPEAVSQAKPGHFDGFMVALAWLAFLKCRSQAVRPQLFRENIIFSYFQFNLI